MKYHCPFCGEECEWIYDTGLICESYHCRDLEDGNGYYRISIYYADSIRWDIALCTKDPNLFDDDTESISFSQDLNKYGIAI